MSAWRSPSKLRVRKWIRPDTGALKMPVETALPFHFTVRGSPTLTERTLIGLGLPYHLGFSAASTHAIVEHPTASLQKILNLRGLLHTIIGEKSKALGLTVRPACSPPPTR